MPKTNLPADGSIAALPDGAPVEIASPLDSSQLSEMARAAEQKQIEAEARGIPRGERELKPLTYGQTEAPKPTLSSVITGKKIDGLDPFYAKLNAEPKPEAVEPLDRSLYPAGSNTDSPSRGTPGSAPIPAGRKTAPPKVTGGFGDVASSQYFPLTGPELLVAVRDLMDRLNDRIGDDLRFSIALTYPRVNVKLQLVVQGEANSNFEIEYVFAHEKTPLEVAQQHGESVCFVVKEQRREFTDEGEVESPPDALRVELGLVAPRKQRVQTGAGYQTVDVV